MHQILVYADSLSWGIIPGTRRRLDFGVDGIRLDRDQHRQLGLAMVEVVARLLLASGR